MNDPFDPEREATVRDGLEAVAEWEAEHGAFTDEELEEARRRVTELLHRADLDPPPSAEPSTA